MISTYGENMKRGWGIPQNTGDVIPFTIAENRAYSPPQQCSNMVRKLEQEAVYSVPYL
jgi:hypothetical protein